MDCARCLEVVSARLDAEASAADHAAAEGHLRVCAPCRDLAARMACLDPWVRDARRDDGPDLLATVMARFGPDGEACPDADLAPVVATVVPASSCGCDSGCRCGCQAGRACRCGRGAA